VAGVHAFEQGVLGKQIADGRWLARVPWNSLNADPHLERHLDRLRPCQSRSRQEMQLSLSNGKIVGRRQYAVADTHRGEQHDEPLGRVELHLDVTARNVEPDANRLTDRVMREVEPWVVTDLDGYHCVGVVVVFNRYHLRGELHAAFNSVRVAGRETRPCMVKEDTVRVHGGSSHGSCREVLCEGGWRGLLGAGGDGG
jgi:hypothetical protein